jgi:hypothetical protein
MVCARTERGLSKIAHVGRIHLKESNSTIRGWQRDLSVSYQEIGDVLVIAGKREPTGPRRIMLRERLDDARTGVPLLLALRLV